MNADRITFTVRMPRADYELLQRAYYAQVSAGRQSFNAFVLELISGAYDARMTADRLIAMDVYTR